MCHKHGRQVLWGAPVSCLRKLAGVLPGGESWWSSFGVKGGSGNCAPPHGLVGIPPGSSEGENCLGAVVWHYPEAQNHGRATSAWLDSDPSGGQPGRTSSRGKGVRAIACAMAWGGPCLHLRTSCAPGGWKTQDSWKGRNQKAGEPQMAGVAARRSTEVAAVCSCHLQHKHRHKQAVSGGPVCQQWDLVCRVCVPKRGAPAHRQAGKRCGLDKTPLLVNTCSVHAGL